MSEPISRRVLAFGEPTAGDDAAGPAVLAALRGHGVPPGTALGHLRDPSALVTLLDDPLPTIVVDAVLAPPAGRVLDLSPDDLAAGIRERSSSHGLGVARAIGLARVLGADLEHLRIVAITIDAPRGEGLSEPVAIAVPVAALHVLRLLRDLAACSPSSSPALRTR